MKDRFCLKKFRREFTRENYRLLLYCAIASVLVTVCVEILARRSLVDALTFALTRFPAFCYNALIVFFTMSVALIFRRRTFALLVAGGTWIGVAIADCILLSYRSTPLTASDIWVLASIRDIFDKYMSYFTLAIMMLLISVAIALIIYILYKTKKYPAIYAFALTNFLLTLIVFIGATQLLQSLGWVQKTSQFQNLPRAYRENGFCYCFGASLLPGGVSEPETYSKEAVESIQNTIVLPETTDDTPNIIFVQLESFFDPNYMKDLNFAENPVPNFQALREAYPSGFLSVPCIGAGTVNTEFEVLTGMNLSHFTPGEYPYSTIVDSSSPETIASALRSIGYRTHAIHNNNATFYDRHTVYANLSFETFTPLEYMDLNPETDFTPTQWAKDACLASEITKCLQATQEKDFVLAVSVQPHGRYPTEYNNSYEYLNVEGMSDSEREIGFEYYLYQLRQTDAFIGELVDTLTDFDERTVVVFYGDHMPSFNIAPDELSAGDEQSTEYIIWSNFDLGTPKRDLQTYQLAAYVMEICQIYEGEIFRLHQSRGYDTDTDENFQSELAVFEYDMLDGEQYLLDGKLLQPTQMRFDVEDVLFHRIELGEQETYHIYGENFTPYSAVYINGEYYPTQFVSREELIVQNVYTTPGDEWVIAQISAADDMQILSQTAPITWAPETEIS